MTTSRAAAAAAAATAATDALAGQAAVAAQQAILARQVAAAAAQRAEFTYIAGLPPTRRSVAQNTRLSVFLATAPRTQQAGPTALHALSTAVHVLEIQRGGTVYRLNDPSDGFYIVVDGRVILYDVKDRDESEEDDGMVERLGRTDSFGEEDLLSNSRRAHRADVGADSSALLLRVPPELYRKYLLHVHQPDFEDKVGFLAQLEVFRQLPDDTLRKLAPCFSQVELRAREYLVKQGERADSMYAIASGQCSVLVDPNHRPETGVPAESDPKKAMQVCLIGPGNIVGDMTVLANIRKRTASILCLTDLVIYKIRRATFIRRVPSIQLEALRQVAEAKLRITERRLYSAAAGPGGGGGRNSAPVMLTLRDKILHGHDLRQLAHPPSVGPLELRGLNPGSLPGGVENLLANSLAAPGGGGGALPQVDGALLAAGAARLGSATQVRMLLPGVFVANVLLEAPGCAAPLRVAVDTADKAFELDPWATPTTQVFRRLSALATRVLTYYVKRSPLSAAAARAAPSGAPPGPAPLPAEPANPGAAALEDLLLWLLSFRDLFSKRCAATGKLMAWDPSVQFPVPPIFRLFKLPREELRLRALDLSRVPAYHMHVAPVEQLGWEEDVPAEALAALAGGGPDAATAARAAAAGGVATGAIR